MSEDEIKRAREQVEKVLSSATIRADRSSRRILEILLGLGVEEEIDQVQLGVKLGKLEEVVKKELKDGSTLYKTAVARLRKVLDLYYQTEGKGDPITVRVKGGGQYKLLYERHTFTISGTITPATEGVGATVTLSGTRSGTAPVDASGEYRFPDLTKGPYEVVPSRSGFEFEPASQSLNVNDTDQSANFTVTASGHVIAHEPKVKGDSETVAQAAVTQAGARWKFAQPAAGAVVFAAGALLAVAFSYFYRFPHRLQQQPEAQVFRYKITFDEGERYASGRPLMAVISHKGRYVAFSDGVGKLQVRDLEKLEPTKLNGTDRATFPFWSPDDKYLGFFADGQLKKIGWPTGSVLTICGVTDPGVSPWNPRGGTWSGEKIVFSPGPDKALLQVSDSGCTNLAPATQLGCYLENPKGSSNEGHRFPEFLSGDPDRFLFNVISDNKDAHNKSVAGVYIGSLNSAKSCTRVLVADSSAQYVPFPGGQKTGYVLYRKQNALFAEPFDPVSPKTLGNPPQEIAPRVADNYYSASGAFSASPNGNLIYRQIEYRELAWVDRTGHAVLNSNNDPLRSTPQLIRPDERLALSPDDQKIAISIDRGGHSNINIVDADLLSEPKQFSAVGGDAWYPVWSPKGLGEPWLAYGVQLEGVETGEMRAAPLNKPPIRKELGGEQLLLSGSEVNTGPWDWRLDAAGSQSTILYRRDQLFRDFWLLQFKGTPALKGEAAHGPLSKLPSRDKRAGRLSPNGKWLAYAEGEFPSFEVDVQAYPPNGSEFQVSLHGGTQPSWRSDGKEFYYISGEGEFMAVSVTSDGRPDPKRQESLFHVPMGVTDVAPASDGTRFLLNEPACPTPPSVTVAINWQLRLDPVPDDSPCPSPKRSQ